MISFIVAVDSKQGMADEHGIPWQGKIPTDTAFFRQQAAQNEILMGFRTYQEFSKPMPAKANYVLTHDDQPLRQGFTPVTDLARFVNEHPDALIIGGAGVFAQALQYADRLYITQVDADFHCTKFFPEHSDFEKVSQSETRVENNIPFRFEIWHRKKTK